MGAAVDFTGSTDRAADELERRDRASSALQYLTAVHGSGSMPPQETGLLANSWDNGKFHLEMHWWNAAHFVPWGRGHLLERSLAWGTSACFRRHERPQPARASPAHAGPSRSGPTVARARATRHPSWIWQQPHPLYFAELLYRADPTAEAAARHAEIVDASATGFMAASSVFERDFEYHLLPPLIPAQESYSNVSTATDPTFELAYWWWGLRSPSAGVNDAARSAATRSGPAYRPAWHSPATAAGGTRRSQSIRTSCASTTLRCSPPALFPPRRLIDPTVMCATLHDVLREWDWTPRGARLPIMAMCATRTGDPAAADRLVAVRRAE